MQGRGWLFGLGIAAAVATVIVGGLRSIARVTGKLVPFMALAYVLLSLLVLYLNAERLPWAINAILTEAFSPAAISGGTVAVMILGFQRAAFSNEAGIGSAAIAHAAVRTEEPATEGFVALMEPFIDTVVVCTMTALVIIITGSYQADAGMSGVDLTSAAFADVIPWFPYVLTIAVVLFAFSTMLSWSYYGLQSWMYLFGRSKVTDTVYKIIFCLFIIIGSAASLDAVIGFSDAMIFAMVVPNMIGLLFLLPDVRKELQKYVRKIRTGEIETVK
jgi:AGCS family alanine or glycine:cation symporter